MGASSHLRHQNATQIRDAEDMPRPRAVRWPRLSLPWRRGSHASYYNVRLVDGVEINVGWAPSLHTFAGVVVGPATEGEPRVRVRVGLESVGEVPSLDALWEALGEYADRVVHLSRQLEDDRLQNP
jgi:hypothetical protein